MSAIHTAIDWLLHLDKHLTELVDWAGPYAYVVLGLIVFCETGLVVTPFLPGDSLLFAAGALCALGTEHLRAVPLGGVLILAALCGDNVNYWIGRKLGAAALARDSRLLKRKHIERTQEFFGRYGSKAVVLARFVPIVRTFTPFVAGIGAMPYRRFLGFSVLGAVAWVVLFLGAGVYFGNLPAVRKNFTLVVLAIIAVSLLPIAIEFWKARRARRAAA